MKKIDSFFRKTDNNAKSEELHKFVEKDSSMEAETVVTCEKLPKLHDIDYPDIGIGLGTPETISKILTAKWSGTDHKFPTR